MNHRVSTHDVNLTKQEISLIDESHPSVLARMSEESLKELQGRLRRARDKHFSLLRRQGAAAVQAAGSRGGPEQASERHSEKVLVFDEALARVHDRLDAVGDVE